MLTCWWLSPSIQAVTATLDMTKMSSNSRPRLEGIVPPMVTPLLAWDQLDPGGLERVVEHLLKGGVHGLFILGTTGEAASLGYGLRRQVVEQVCRHVAGRIPVLVGITDTVFEESINMARVAAEHGAASVVVAAPFLMSTVQKDLQAYLSHLVSQSPLPVYLYHVPPLTKTRFELETVRWAMDQDRIIGLKDSAGDLNWCEQVCALLPRRPDWSLLAGPEELLADYVARGAHGGVCGGANLFPQLYVRFYEAARASDARQIELLRSQVQTVVENLYRLEDHPSAIIKALKCALSQLGLCQPVLAEPFQPFGAEKQRVVGERLAKLQQLLGLGPEH
jgi:dihydrodipicolinate synthase/N-acetylneuraminate lyase